jgi:hypothetical protein
VTEVLTILQELRRDRERISEAATALYKTSLELYGGIDHETGEVRRGLSDEFNEARDNELIELEERYLTNGQRLPAQDLREARVTRSVRQKYPELYERFLALDATEKALKQTISSRKAAVGAAQSILKGEKE